MSSVHDLIADDSEKTKFVNLEHSRVGGNNDV